MTENKTAIDHIEHVEIWMTTKNIACEDIRKLNLEMKQLMHLKAWTMCDEAIKEVNLEHKQDSGASTLRQITYMP